MKFECAFGSEVLAVHEHPEDFHEGGGTGSVVVGTGRPSPRAIVDGVLMRAQDDDLILVRPSSFDPRNNRRLQPRVVEEGHLC